MTNRRKFITLLGGGVVVAAGGIGIWATTRDPVNARKPWAMAGQVTGEGADDPRRFALSYAVLAPNPHNRQPWVADLSVADEVTLYCDLDRRLPHTDPYDRQITVGLGCFSELLVMSAAEAGYRVDTDFFPDGDPAPRLDGRPVARFRFTEEADAAKDPLFKQIPERRSNKEAFDVARAPDADAADAILAAARTVRTGKALDAASVESLRALAWDALMVETLTPHTLKESLDLLRIGRAEIEANPDGIDLPGPMFEALDAFGLMAREDMMDTNSTAFRQQIAAMKEPFDTATGFVWFITPGNARKNQIDAGRDYVRANLAATGLGVSMHPLSQALQEYPEMAEHFDAMRSATGTGEGETLQMFARIGYGPRIEASPRWPYETRIRSA